MNVVEGIVDLSRVFPAAVEVVFAAWSTEAAQRSWGDPGEGWTMAFERFSFAVGESDICRFGPEGGADYVNENRYVAIQPGRRIVYATSLSSEGRLTFAGTVAVTFEKEGDGTLMRLVENGLYFDGQDDAASHRAGWEGMLAELERYVRGER